MENTRVRDIMSHPPITILPTATVPQALAVMRRHKIRHLPVVENGELVGIISMGDLREASTTAAINADSYELNFMLNRLAVSKIMNRKVTTVTPDAFIVDAAEIMTENKIAGLPVVEPNGAVIGIITDSDLLRLLVRKYRQGDERAPETQEQAG